MRKFHIAYFKKRNEGSTDPELENRKPETGDWAGYFDRSPYTGEMYCAGTFMYYDGEWQIKDPLDYINSDNKEVIVSIKEAPKTRGSYYLIPGELVYEDPVYFQDARLGSFISEKNLI